RFSMIGCMNSTDTWAASQEDPPLPITNSRPPVSNALAIAVQQATIRSAFSVKNFSLVAMLSRLLRRIAARSSAVGIMSNPPSRPKSEIRNSKSETDPNTKDENLKRLLLEFGLFLLGFWICFGFRVSDFGFVRFQVPPVRVIGRAGTFRRDHRRSQ